MIKKIIVVLAVISIVLGVTACSADVGQDTTDGTLNMRDGDRTDIQGGAMEPEDKFGSKEETEGEDKSNVENEAAGSGAETAVENEVAGSGDEAVAENKAAGSGGEADAREAVEPQNELADEKTGGQTEMKMNVQIGDYNFTATLESNTAVDELMDMMKEGPVTIDMDDYSGFEKVGSLGRSLTTSNSQTTTTAGDIVLYNGSNIVMFYGSNSWSYTRIGKIDDLTDWERALGKGSITAVFTIAE